MMANYIRIKFFFFLLSIFPLEINALNVPDVKPRPYIKLTPFSDVFQQIKKQNWVMAIKLADDHNNKALSSYIRWLDITRPGSKHNFDYLVDFFNNHKNWPKQEILIEKIESSIHKGIPTDSLINWFKENPPQTSKGSIDHLEVLIKNGSNFDKRKKISEIWIKKNLTSSQQKYFIKNYSRYWNQEDNWKRFNRLMIEGKTFSARKTLNRIKGDLRKLGEARLSLSRRSPNVSELIRNVPTELKNDPDLIYERMRWRRKAKLDTASDLLLNPPTQISNVRGWWINSRIVIRRLLNKKKYLKAYNILSQHTLPVNTDSGLEAEWLAGWVAFSFLDKKELASKHFNKVFDAGGENYKAKAAFWLGLLFLNDNRKESIEWFKKSELNKFSYYGQNASLKINNFKIPKIQSRIIKPKNSEQLLDVLKIIKESKKSSFKSYPFYKKLLELSKTQEEKNYILELANNENNKNIIVKLSKSLDTPTLKYSYPLIEEYIPDKFRNSKEIIALIHAIAHQESNFKINAYSSAGARGMMQLMPYTAKRVCKSLGIRYYKKKLTTNAQYNILLGTTYINQMLKRFNNSLPLALASYNAGPGRVKIWLKRYGDPRTDEISYHDWIESIPISETRFYVKKVISNLRIYQQKYNLKIYL